MKWGRGTTLFAAACLLRLGFWVGQQAQSPYPLAQTPAARHTVQLRQIVEQGVRSEADQELARAACAAVLVECILDGER